ncbi:MAG: formylmethanofuran dehydrogenase subunit A [Planctomycetota bacterium]
MEPPQTEPAQSTFSRRIRLAGGAIHDPTNGIDGEVRDLWIDHGKIVERPENAGEFQTIDVSGRVVMAGGIDMHCHIAGPKVNAGRMMQPEQFMQNPVSSTQLDNGQHLFSGGMGSVPTIFTTGYKYTGLGYTTCFDAAVSPMAARHVHFEFDRIPNVDTGFFTLVGNNHYAMKAAAAGDTAAMKAFLGWLLHRVGSYAPKIVNPGGVENWKHERSGNARDLDAKVHGFDVTPRQILQSVTRAANELALPHPVHIHTNNLGVPGNWSTTLETMKSLDGLRAHLTHIQFHSYGGCNEEETSLCSKVATLAEFVNANPLLTVDVGQVMFGRTTSMTGDSPLGQFLHQVSGEKWYSADLELESGCGVSPIDYKNKNFVNALQWAIGLEWYLLVNDPWQVVMSTDHPNGGSFLAYPQIIRLLMDREFRREKLAEVHPSVLKHSQLADIEREYTLNEVAVITRAGPARILGLNHKGHLGPGADADVCVYSPDPNFQTMFELPWMVIKDGKTLVHDTEIRTTISGNTITANPSFDGDQAKQIESWFEQEYSIPLDQFGWEPKPETGNL